MNLFCDPAQASVTVRVVGENDLLRAVAVLLRNPSANIGVEAVLGLPHVTFMDHERETLAINESWRAVSSSPKSILGNQQQFTFGN
jgi:hypothetical protein